MAFREGSPWLPSGPKRGTRRVVLRVDELDDPRRWYSTNLVGVSSELLASIDFNDFPRRLSIAGTRPTHAGLFDLLRVTGSQKEATEVFAHYMAVAFGTEPDCSTPIPEAEARSYRSNYVRLLQGWGFDANGAAGAVLKGWVESRFGIVPTFHKAPLDRFPSDVWMGYLEEKLGSRFHNSCIQLQLDLLFEYCQWCLVRFEPFGARDRVALYRGANPSEVHLLRGSLRERAGVVRLNNVVSFSLSRERAEEFGDILLTAEVPLAKVLFYPGLIQDRVLDGEGESLVIGGDFEVLVSYA